MITYYSFNYESDSKKKLFKLDKNIGIYKNSHLSLMKCCLGVSYKVFQLLKLFEYLKVLKGTII